MTNNFGATQLYSTIGDVFWWIMDDMKKYQTIVEQGGTSSGKTYSIMQLLALIAITEQNSVITVCGQDLPNLKRGALRDIETIIDTSPILSSFIRQFNKSSHIIHFYTNSIIEFVSYQKGQDAKSGKRDYLFINEANGVRYDVYQELSVRTSKNVFIDYNATAAFWVHEHVLGKKGVVRHISNFSNNPYISEKVLSDILYYKEVDEFRWNVYGLGKTGILKENQWLHSFDADRHIKKVTFIENEPIIISIDFNVEKFTALAIQCSDIDNLPGSYFHVIKEFVMTDQFGTLGAMAAHIRQTFPTAILYITGDQSGSRRDVGYSKSNDTLLTLLQKALNIGNGQMMFGSYSKRYPAANPSFQNSWAHCNNVLSLHKNFCIDPSCKSLINDCRIATFEKGGSNFMLKKTYGTDTLYAMNALDCLRYAINMKCPNFAKIGNKSYDN